MDQVPEPPAASSATAAARRRRAWLMGSGLIAAAALGPLLVVSALYSQATVRRVATAVLRSEAETWTRTVTGQLRSTRAPVTPETLRAVLDEYREQGLHYLARIGREGKVEAGTSLAPGRTVVINPGDPRNAGGQIEWLGTRVRYVAAFRMGPGMEGRRGFLPPWEARSGAPPPGPMPPPPGGLLPPPALRAPHPPGIDEPRGPPPTPPLIVLEFEPRLAPALLTAARRTLGLGLLTAVTIAVLAGWVWLSLRRYHAMERAAEHARHLAALGEMSAVLAHEIRNPLASLKGHAQLLTESLAAPGMERAAGKATRIVDEAVRIEKITTDLLDFVRKGDVTREHANLVELVRASLADVVPAGRLRLDLPTTPVVVAMDAVAMRQVIENVARNAVQASADKSSEPVEVALRADDGVVLTIRDHGPGIPPGARERIFEPFVTTRTRGTGLGLSIARRIVTQHGGSLTADNHPEGGAIFRLTLPGHGD
jgi:two-component system sensor histidine kinase HydH